MPGKLRVTVKCPNTLNDVAEMDIVALSSNNYLFTFELGTLRRETVDDTIELAGVLE